MTGTPDIEDAGGGGTPPESQQQTIKAVIHYGAGIVYPSKLDGLTAFQSSAIALVGASVSLSSIVVSRALAWTLLSRRVFTRRILVIGSGSSQEKITITRC